MTMHYHGTPITPRRVLLEMMPGRSFCVSFAAPGDVGVVHQIGQSVMLDNGAFSFWRSARKPDWPAYYAWSERWLDFQTTWAVIPDVIDGGPDANDALLAEWPHGTRGAPVWHLDEPIARLLTLAGKWPRVCLGSAGAYATVGDARWHGRMVQAMNSLCGDGPPPVWLHMLRGLSVLSAGYPFASADSTDIAQNHHLPHKSARAMADRWDCVQSPGRWTRLPEQADLLGSAAA